MKREPAATAVIIIDAQKLFIPGEASYFPKYIPEQSVEPALDNLKKLITLADDNDLPLLFTYELSDTGGSALADRLKAVAPPGALSFVKSFFDATSHAEFAEMVRATGATRVVIGGAETDVCVLQSVLGLLEMGLEVVLLRDSVFTNEVNVSPALDRMRQAGARLIGFDQLREVIVDGVPLANGETEDEMAPLTPAVPHRVEAGNNAFVVVDVVAEAVAEDSGDHLEAAVQRLQQAMFVSHVFDVPFFVVNDSTLESRLPEGFAAPAGDVVHLTYTSQSPAEAPGLVEGLRQRGIEQVIVLGVSTQGSVYRAASDLNGGRVHILCRRRCRAQ